MLQESTLLIIPILFPVCMGLVLLLGPKWEERGKLCIYTGTGLLVTAVLVISILSVLNGEVAFTFFHLTKNLPVYFKLDRIGRLFVGIVTVVWLCAGLFSFEYMKHEKREQRYYGFYLMVYGILMGLGFSGNLVTFYLFYEIMTLLSLPLVLHTQTREAVLAGMKYLFYSMCGAYMVLFGLYFLYRFTNTLTFTAGGVLDLELIQGREPLMLAVGFLMLLGFGVKAGLFPLHGWLTAAHPAAPAPASAVLSGVIVKAGVLGAIRVVYYLFGPDFLRGTWVQTAWLVLILITILMGSMMAYREKIWKKRLAYSTVSQVSYILLGLAMMQPMALEGALLHMVFHAVIKSGLFLTAGAMIYYTGKKRVEEYIGIGRRMPVVLSCYIGLTLALIGIPPASGFVSKWYLALGSLNSTRDILGILGPVVLLVSALLTAGYLLPVAIKGFLPGAGWREESPDFVRVSVSAAELIPGKASEQPEELLQERTPEQVGQSEQERLSEQLEESVQERMPEKPEELLQERTPEQVGQSEQERLSEQAEESVQERMPEQPEELLQERTLEQVEQSEQERLSEQPEESVQERMPEQQGSLAWEEDSDPEKVSGAWKISWKMTGPILVLAVLAVGLGIFAGPLCRITQQIAEILLPIK